MVSLPHSYYIHRAQRCINMPQNIDVDNNDDDSTLKSLVDYDLDSIISEWHPSHPCFSPQQSRPIPISQQQWLPVPVQLLPPICGNDVTIAPSPDPGSLNNTYQPENGQQQRDDGWLGSTYQSEYGHGYYMENLLYSDLEDDWAQLLFPPGSAFPSFPEEGENQLLEHVRRKLLALEFFY